MVVGGDCVCTLWFIQPDAARSLLLYLCPLQSLCHALSSGVNHNATARGQHFPSPSLAGSQTWVSSTTRGRRLAFEGQPLLLHSMGREQGWGHLRASLGFGYSNSSLPSCPSLSLDNFLYKEDFPWSAHRVGVTWVQAGFTRLSPDV